MCMSIYVWRLDHFPGVMQNDYDELFTLLNWAVPGGLGDWQHFQQFYEAPIKMAQKKDADETALGRVCCSPLSLLALVCVCNQQQQRRLASVLQTACS